jgi:hypothetical protein
MQDNFVFKKIAEERLHEVEFWKQKCSELSHSGQNNQQLTTLIEGFIGFVGKFFEPKYFLSDQSQFSKELSHLQLDFEKVGLRSLISEFSEQAKRKQEYNYNQNQHTNSQIEGAVLEVLGALEGTQDVSDSIKEKLKKIETVSNELERVSRSFERNLSLSEKELLEFASSFKSSRDKRDPASFLLEYFKLHQQQLHRFNELLLAQNRVYRSGLGNFFPVDTEMGERRKIDLLKGSIMQGMDKLLRSLRLPALFEEMCTRSAVSSNVKELIDLQVT